MSTTLLRMPDVVRRCGISKASVYSLIRAGKFPKPIRLSRSSAWIDVEVDDWIAERITESRRPPTQAGAAAPLQAA